MLESDELTFIRVYQHHVEALYRYVYRRCRDHSLAEDVTQETFYRAMDSGRDPSSITFGWLITVARNRLFDVLRRQVHYEEKLRVVANSLSPIGDVDPIERLQIETALQKLPVHYRLALTLHYMEGSSMAEIADELDRTVKSVEGILTRARRALANELESTNAPLREPGRKKA